MAPILEARGKIQTPIGEVDPPKFRLGAYHIDRLQRLKPTFFGFQEVMPAHEVRTHQEQQIREMMAQRHEWEELRRDNPFIDYGYSPAFDPRNPEKPETFCLAYKRAHTIVGGKCFWSQLPFQVIEDMNLFSLDTDNIVPVLPECTESLDALLLTTACNLVQFYALEKHLDRFKRNTVPNTSELSRASLDLFHRQNGRRLMHPVLYDYGAEQDTLDFFLPLHR